MVTNIRFVLAALAVVFLSVTVAHAADPAVKCESGKLKEAGKYSNCRLKADSKAVKKGVAADYSKCESKFADKWSKTETKAGPGICPSEGDQVNMDARITTDAAEIATLLAGGSLPASCGNGTVEAGEDCDFGDLGGGTCASEGFLLSGDLSCGAGCVYDTAACFTCSDVGGVEVGGACWFLALSSSCDDVCGDAGLVYDDATRTYAGSDGTGLQCEAVLDALSVPADPFVDDWVASGGWGCAHAVLIEARFRYIDPPTNSSAFFDNLNRACACM
jgi:hypothetical protein